MKKSLLFKATLPSFALASFFAMAEDELTTGVNNLVEELRSSGTVSEAELLGLTNKAEKSRQKFHGTLGSNVEIEHLSRGDGIEEGKVKVTYMQGNFRHDGLPGWDFGFYAGREELYSGKLLEADYNRGVNAIEEVYVNKNFKINDKFNVGLGGKLASESIDKRLTPEIKAFTSYQITDKLDFHGYGLFHTEFKRDIGKFHYWEMEPGFGYKLADNMGMWLNFRYQEGYWHPSDDLAYKEDEQEMIIKPGAWYNWDKFSASVWAEIGWFEKNNSDLDIHAWSEDYVKVGLSGNYRLTDSWRLFGQASYKFTDYTAGADKDTTFDGETWGVVVGLDYSF